MRLRSQNGATDSAAMSTLHNLENRLSITHPSFMFVIQSQNKETGVHDYDRVTERLDSQQPYTPNAW